MSGTYNLDPILVDGLVKKIQDKLDVTKPHLVKYLTDHKEDIEKMMNGTSPILYGDILYEFESMNNNLDVFLSKLKLILRDF